jgi:hypothetical protein
MTLKGVGPGVCDRCGTSVENASIDKCVIVSDIDPDSPGTMRTLHFCRENGCAKKVLSKRNLRYLLEGDAGEPGSDG